VNIPSSPWAIVGLIVLAIVLVYLFANIVMPLLRTIT
jgi:hypothetical protein